MRARGLQFAPFRSLCCQRPLGLLRHALLPSANLKMVKSPARRKEVVEETTLASDSYIGRRIDSLLPELFPGRYTSMAGAKRAIRRREVHINGFIATTEVKVCKGDIVQVMVKAGSGPVWAGTAGKPGLDLVYEDDHMACIIKPQGLPTQGKGEATVQGRIKYCLRPSPLPGALFRPHHVHRLDAGTGGLVLVAKTRAAAAALAMDLAEHNMQKRYLALLIGQLEGQGMVNYPLSGKPAITLFSTMSHTCSATFGHLTWVHLWPKTGRTHQLRKHMAYIGHPILGDLQYKLHRKPECQVTPLASVQQYLSQLDQHLAVDTATNSTVAAAGSAAVAHQGAQQQQDRHQQLALPSHNNMQELVGRQQQKQEWLQQDVQGHSQQQPHCQQQAVPAPPLEGPSCITSLRSPSSRGGASHLWHQVWTTTGIKDCCEYEFENSSGSVLVGDNAGSESGEQSSQSRRQQQLLQDGSSVEMCLWAVQLQLLHPATREMMDLHTDLPIALYEDVCKRDAPKAQL